jgi:2-amino-4-hydroxy-6-hydroxymethyldihydropteridine diphosphokinase
MINTIYLGIGGNIGDRWQALEICRNKLFLLGEVKECSQVYKTAAWGNTNQTEFYNQVIKIITTYSAAESLQMIQHIEANMGRIRKDKWGERIMDIDILFYNNEVIEDSNLQIPHPLLHTRKFVLVPLAEIASSFFHPILRKNIATLLLECNDDLSVFPVLQSE